MQKKIIVLTLASLLASSLWAANNQKIIDKDTLIYSTLEALYLEQGLAPPFPSSPWSEEEIRLYLERIDEEDLSPAGRRALKQLRNALKIEVLFLEEDSGQAEEAPPAETSFLIFNCDLYLNLESYLHYTLSAPENWDPASYVWAHGYAQRLPFLALPLELWAGEHLYLYSALEAREEHLAIDNPDAPAGYANYWNLFDFNAPLPELSFPLKAYLSTGARHWNLQLGRDKLDWGNGLGGNLLLSDAADYYDFLRFTTFWQTLKFTSVYLVQDPFLPDGTSVAYQAFTGHRLDLRLFKRLNLALNEGLVFSAEAPQLVRQLNPVMLFHNWDDDTRGNSLFSLECSINPWQYFTLYGQVALDELPFLEASAQSGDGGSGAKGYLLGGKLALPLGENYLKLALEYTETDPNLYHRSRPPYYYNVHRYWSLATDAFTLITTPLGHPQGGDLQQLRFEAGYNFGPHLRTRLDLEYLNQGEQTVFDNYANGENVETPSGTAQQSLLVHTNLENTTFTFLATGIDLYLVSLWNAEHVEGARRHDFEFIWYLKYKAF